jgi:ribA/ribD-fused uncharacterized protein
MIDKFEGKYFFLSNFYPCEITYKGITYPSTEHAFAAAKSNDKQHKLYCSNPDITPGQAKKAGRKCQLIDDWDNIRLEVMKELLTIKFSKEPLRSMLLETEDKELVEGNWWNDTFWGVCNGIGQNNLGKLLMKLRESLR